VPAGAEHDLDELRGDDGEPDQAGHGDARDDPGGPQPQRGDPNGVADPRERGEHDLLHGAASRFSGVSMML